MEQYENSVNAINKIEARLKYVEPILGSIIIRFLDPVDIINPRFSYEKYISKAIEIFLKRDVSVDEFNTAMMSLGFPFREIDGKHYYGVKTDQLRYLTRVANLKLIEDSENGKS